MIILTPVDLDATKLDIVHLEVGFPHANTTIVTLETVHIELEFLASPSMPLVSLDTVHLTLVAEVIPPSSPIVVSLSVAHLVISPSTFTYTKIYYDETKNILKAIIAHGSARQTPVAFVPCDLMDIMNYIRDGGSEPVLSYDDSCKMSDLLNAIDNRAPIPFEVPVIGTWCGDEDYNPEEPPFAEHLIRRVCTATRYGYTAGNVFNSTNYGRDFMLSTSLDLGISYTTLYILLFIYIDNATILLACTNSGTSSTTIFRGQNYGTLWSRTDVPTSVVPIYSYFMSLCDLGEGILLAGVCPYSQTGTQTAQIIGSTNYGATWTSKKLFTATWYYPSNIVKAGNNIVASICGIYSNSGSIYYSTDNGSTWVLSTTPAFNSPQGSGIKTVPLLYLGNGVVVFCDSANTTSNFMRSTDYGVTFSRITLTPSAHSGNCFTWGKSIGDGHAFVSNNVGTWMTHDYGVTWTRTGITYYPYFMMNSLLDFGSGNLLCTSYGDYTSDVYFSTDYGATWTPLTVVWPDLSSRTNLPNGSMVYIP